MASAFQLLKRHSEITALERIDPERTRLTLRKTLILGVGFQMNHWQSPGTQKLKSIQVSNQARNLTEEDNRSGTGRRARTRDPNDTICLFLPFAFLFKG